MDKEQIRKAIISMIEGLIPLNSTWCKVVSITGQSCKVKVDGLEIEDILLGFDKSGVIVFPKVNTDVLVAFIDNSKTNGAVIYVKETDKIEIMGDANGGLVKSAKVSGQLNKLEQDINTVKQIFSAWVPVPNDGGGALKTAISTWSGQQLVQTQKEILENEKVKHGE